MRNQREEAQLRHIQRITTAFGESPETLLRRLYIEERQGTPEVCRQLGLTYRMLRTLFLRYDIPMRSIAEGVAITWQGADDRRSAASAHMACLAASLDMTGDNNPAKRPEVRSKISASKRGDRNPMADPEVRARMVQTQRRKIANGEIEHINVRMARGHRRSRIERIMQRALRDAGVIAEHGHRIGRRWPDLVVPAAGLVVECDGVRWHPDGPDPVRDQELREAGWQVLHFTDERIVPDAAGCAAEVVAWLEARGLHPSATSEDRMLRGNEERPVSAAH